MLAQTHALHTSMPVSSASTRPGSSGAPSYQPQPLPPASFSLLAEVFSDYAFVSDLHLAFMKRDERLVKRADKPQRTTGPGKPRATISKKPSIEKAPRPEVAAPQHRHPPERHLFGGGQIWFDGVHLSAQAGSAPATAPAPAAAPNLAAAFECPTQLGAAPLRLPLAPHDPNAAWGSEMELLAKHSRAGVQPSAEQWLWALEAARQRNREAAARAAVEFGQLNGQSHRPIAEAA